MKFEQIAEMNPYSLSEAEKNQLLTERLKDLTKLHLENCFEYKKMMDAIGFDLEAIDSYKDIPFLPVH